MMRLQFATATCSLGALLLIGLAGCAETPAAAPPQPPKVTVMGPEQRELTNYEEFNGWMAADKTVDVRARVRGHIMKVNFTDGQYVKKGDLLFELDPRPFQAEIGAIQDKIRIFEAQKKAADSDEARYRELVPQRAASMKDLDKAEATAASLGAEIEATKNQATTGKARFGVFANHSRYRRPNRQGRTDRRQPGQRRRQRSTADDHRICRSDSHLLQCR